jgi:serine phosphatase RsbU (regulator of sigma subunit)
LIATQARTTDLYNLHRRRRSLSLAASMQWDLLPPLVLKTPAVNLAGLLEPAYEVGGDCFDYALNDASLNVGVMDAMGHGVGSALISALAIGSYRHDRREGRSLEHIHTNIDEVIAAHCPPFAFATGQLAQLDIESGTLTWTNAGHPLPFLIREGSVIGEIECRPTPPWGLGSAVERDATPSVASASLEPGDSVLFYTDGVTEAHKPGGELFGVERLVDVIGKHASDQAEPEEIVRQVVTAILEYKADQLADDATLVLIRWNGATTRPDP